MFHDATNIPIERLFDGDVIMSARLGTLEDTNRLNKLYFWSSTYLGVRKEPSTIVKINPQVVPRIIQLNGGLLEATPRHTQLVCREGVWRFVQFQDINKGDLLYKVTGETIEVLSVEIMEGDRIAYPITLGNPHLYFANGILTHNVK